MKKLIFLLLMAVFLTGFMPAWDTAYPPWDVSLEAALSEPGAGGYYLRCWPLMKPKRN